LRKLLIAAAVAVAALAGAAVANAYFQNYKQDFAASKTGKPTKKPGSPSGTRIQLASGDTTRADDFPPRLKELDLFLPSGSVIDQSAKPQCGATDADFRSKGTAACPSNTIVGTGDGTVRINGFTNLVPTLTATLYNGKKHKLILYINPSQGQPVVLRAKISGANGSPKIVTKVPLLCAVKNPTTGKCTTEARIASLNLYIKKIGGKGKPAFITTPPTCPGSKKWQFVGTFKYQNATPSSKTIKSNSPCKA